MGKRAPANRVDPEDKDEDEDDCLFVLDQAGIIVQTPIWRLIWTGGGAGDGGESGGVLQLENLEQLLCGGIVMTSLMGGPLDQTNRQTNKV